MERILPGDLVLGCTQGTGATTVPKLVLPPVSVLPALSYSHMVVNLAEGHSMMNGEVGAVGGMHSRPRTLSARCNTALLLVAVTFSRAVRQWLRWHG